MKQLIPSQHQWRRNQTLAPCLKLSRTPKKLKSTRSSNSVLTSPISGISTTEDEVAVLRCKISKFTSTLGELHERTEDTETRAQRNILRLVGLLETLDISDLAVALEA
ncbi:hypothetical protein NDU88_002946 [Pleurodeles waltl]|uniref:Uncharacterized protein n=1 Tax=Pleurodeles waltl TaxID=8319 RepID=A0AAV7NIH2_PLEWA|nr:hypothetical protein NDU88_002946 [Pleurodeles waltl]